MKRTRTLSFVYQLSLCAATASLAACGASNEPSGSPEETGDTAASPALDDRPAGVPSDYRITPSGYLHPDCIIQARPGERVSESGDLVSEDGAVRVIAPCAHSSYDRMGRERVSTAILPRLPRVTVPTLSGWLAYFADTVAGVTWLSADFRVPTSPLNHGSNIVFFFNGLESDGLTELIQPVLQWNQGGFANQWSIAPWYVKNGNGVAGTGVRVNEGDTISGYMYPQGGNSWFIGINQNGNYATGLSVTASAVLNTVIGGAMEVYNVTTCEDLPSTGFEFFTNIALYRNGAPLTPSFSLLRQAPATPNCNAAPFAGTTTGGMTWLYD